MASVKWQRRELNHRDIDTVGNRYRGKMESECCVLTCRAATVDR
jgi:hypothetical protein